VLGLLGDHDPGVCSSALNTVSELVKYGMFYKQHDMLRLMTSEDIQQHITVHNIKTVLGLLGDDNWNVRSSVCETVSEFVKYGMFQEQHDTC
jgi:hypothetical protein